MKQDGTEPTQRLIYPEPSPTERSQSAVVLLKRLGHSQEMRAGNEQILSGWAVYIFRSLQIVAVACASNFIPRLSPDNGLIC